MIEEILKLSDEDLRRILRRELAIESVFREVRKILEDVKKNGDGALKKYTLKFDGADLKQLRVEKGELDRALEVINPGIRQALEKAAANIAKFHEKQKSEKIQLTSIARGLRLWQKTTPLESVGAYVPGGRALYPSTVLMTVIPARIAGVRRIALCTPPKKDCTIDPVILAAAKIAGTDEIYRAGGVQAIAALAYGTESIKSVDKIIGPGNIYVTAAKMLVRNVAEIDFPAGPSEVVILADGSANARFIAIDMLAQAEHAPDAVAILVTTSRALAEKVENELRAKLKKTRRREIAEASLRQSRILLARDLDTAIELVNKIAPEHVEVMVKESRAVLKRIRQAGTIFIGDYSPTALGDYASGANHVLPAGGYARLYSGLNLDHFTRKTTVQMATEEGLLALKDVVITLAEVEGLYAHADSIKERFKK